MFGLTANIFTLVFMFTIFGAFLLKSAPGIYCAMNCSTRRLVVVPAWSGGGFRRMGSVTGSAVANTVSIDMIIIPMMKNQIHSAVRRWSRSRGVHRRRAHAARNGRRRLRIASYTQISYLT